MSRTLTLLNAQLVCPIEGRRSGGLLVQGDSIAAVGNFEIPSDAGTIDCAG